MANPKTVQDVRKMSGTDIAEWLIQMANVLEENTFLKGRIKELEEYKANVKLTADAVAKPYIKKIKELEAQVAELKTDKRVLMLETAQVRTNNANNLKWIAELEAQTKAANHKSHCNYWKWNWKYSWSDSDCTCYAIKREG